MPSLKDRAYIYRKLRVSFREGYTDEGLKLFNQALNRFCVTMGLCLPVVEWYMELNSGKTWGTCSPDGKLELIDPEHWTGSIEQWMHTVYHELGHYYLWSEAEKKADIFAGKMFKRAS